ncbi:MAG: alpha/beta hydrolase [Pseudonocardiales bacterium]|nr:alpha/beta hydrolase [Pseudonocardiales bacterium]
MDPTPVTRAMVAPPLRRALRLVPPLRIRSPWARRLVRAGSRLIPSTAVRGVTVVVPDDAHPGVRVHLPGTRTSDAALLWIHGGGLVIGSAVQDDRHCSATARDLGMPVVAVEYRLAPEHPFPAALDDCHAGWRWLAEHAATLGVDPARVAVGGQSAGGGLAAALVHRLHDGGGVAPAAQWLFCPMLDDRTAARRELDGAGHRVWDNTLNRFGWASYLGVEPGAPQVPAGAVPARRDDLAGLPPTWIGVGDIDLFHDEDLAYAERLRAAGVPVRVDVVRGAPHGFESWAPDTDLARDFVAGARRWLRAELAPR